MNYLDSLPNDVMKIINREVQNAHIIKRRIERKQNRQINREQKQIAEHKRYVYEQFARLYTKYIYRQQKLIEDQQIKAYTQRINEHHAYIKRLQNDICKIYGDLLLHSEQCIGGDEPYIITTLFIDGKIQQIKFK